jgi:hypothetical protein
MSWVPLRTLKPQFRQVTVSRTNLKPQSTSAIFSYGNIRLIPSPASNALTNKRPLGRPTKQDSVLKLNRLPKQLLRMHSIKGQADPAQVRSTSPSPLSKDFARQAVTKQQRSNFHSTSITSGIANTMVSRSVNKTALHPTGVQYVPSSFLQTVYLLFVIANMQLSDPQRSTPRSRRSFTTEHTLIMTV